MESFTFFFISPGPFPQFSQVAAAQVYAENFPPQLPYHLRKPLGIPIAERHSIHQWLPILFISPFCSMHSSLDSFFFFFLNIFFVCFWYGPFLKPLLNLLQYCIYFMFWIFGQKACLAPRARIELAPIGKRSLNHWTCRKTPSSLDSVCGRYTVSPLGMGFPRAPSREEPSTCPSWCPGAAPPTTHLLSPRYNNLTANLSVAALASRRECFWL